MDINDRTGDIQLNDWAGTKNKLSVIDDGTRAIFGIDLRQGGMKVSAGVDVHAADLIQVRDMLTRIIERDTVRRSPAQIPAVISDDPKIAAWRAQES